MFSAATRSQILVLVLLGQILSFQCLHTSSSRSAQLYLDLPDDHLPVNDARHGTIQIQYLQRNTVHGTVRQDDTTRHEPARCRPRTTRRQPSTRFFSSPSLPKSEHTRSTLIEPEPEPVNLRLCLCSHRATAPNPYRTPRCDRNLKFNSIAAPSPPLHLHSSDLQRQTAAWSSAPDPTFNFDSPHPVASSHLCHCASNAGTAGQTRQEDHSPLSPLSLSQIQHIIPLGLAHRQVYAAHQGQPEERAPVLDDNEHLYLLLDRDRFDPFCSLNSSTVHLLSGFFS